MYPPSAALFLELVIFQLKINQIFMLVAFRRCTLQTQIEEGCSSTTIWLDRITITDFCRGSGAGLYNKEHT